MFEVNTSLYTCIEQLFKLEGLLEKCVSSSQAKLWSLYSIKGENIGTTKQQSQFIAFSLFSKLLLKRIVQCIACIPDDQKGNIYHRGREVLWKTFREWKGIFNWEANRSFTLLLLWRSTSYSKHLGQEATA